MTPPTHSPLPTLLPSTTPPHCLQHPLPSLPRSLPCSSWRQKSSVAGTAQLKMPMLDCRALENLYASGLTSTHPSSVPWGSLVQPSFQFRGPPIQFMAPSDLARKLRVRLRNSGRTFALCSPQRLIGITPGESKCVLHELTAAERSWRAISPNILTGISRCLTMEEISTIVHLRSSLEGH